MTAEAFTDPEGVALVAAIHARKLEARLAQAEQDHTNLLARAAGLGTKPAARDAWELVHAAAGITASIRSQLQQHRWTT
jgi:hypothetical protein